MRLSRPSRFLVILICLLPLAGFAAKKKPEPADAPPQLISTKGKAPKWTTVEQLQQFAAKGDPQACLELGDRHLEGDGVSRSVSKAAALYEQAAKAGAPNGWFRLGKIYHDGLEDEPDYGRAMEYFTTAAHAGVVEAQHNIGAMLVSARGVRRDYVEGLAWLIVAKQSGAPSDAESQVRMRLAKRPSDITAAETRAAEISSDLPNATVRANLIKKPAPPAAPANTLEQPSVTPPKLEPTVPPKVLVPVTPVPPVTPGKP